MLFLYNNVAPLIVAIVISSIGWLFGGTRSGYLLTYLPWLLFFLTELALIFPQKEPGETTQDARERVWLALKGDSFTWAAIVFLLLLAIPFTNTGLCPQCDAAAIAGGAEAKPPLPRLPFCVDRLQHLNVYLWFLTAILIAVTVRHALTKDGCRLMLELVVWNGVLLAIFGFIEMAAGACGPLWAKLPGGRQAQDFFSTFGYPNMAGSYFTLLFGIAFALWRYRLDELKSKSLQELGSWAHSPHRVAAYKYFMLVPMLFLFVATVNTLSRAAIILVSALAVVCALHTYHSFTAKLPRARRVKRGIICLVALIIGVVIIQVFTPTKVQHEVNTVGTFEVLDRVTGKRNFYGHVANQLWRDHLLFGCGGWGFRHLGPTYKTPKERSLTSYSGAANVHNDYLQFLVEHGLVGFALIVALVFLLFLPTASAWRYLASVVRFVDKKDQPAPPQSLFVFPGSAFCLLMALLCVLIHAFGDCPFRSAAVMSLWTAALVAINGFLPSIPSAVERALSRHGEHHHHRHHSES